MSEAIPGLLSRPSPAEPKDAAAVVLFRRAEGGGVEVFWLRREATLAFAGGFYAFAGGGLEPDDARVPVEGAQGMDAALRAAAARELLEETGVLVARGAERLVPGQVAALRRALIEKRSSFAELLAGGGLVLQAKDFLEAGRWITPPYVPKRFDARFFLVEAPAGVRPEVWPGELVEGAWVRPREALERWADGRVLLFPPHLHALRTLADFSTPQEAAARLCAPAQCEEHVSQRTEFQRGIIFLPLETPTLPPATHTNCYLAGNGELLIVDPGSDEESELSKLLALVDALGQEGKRPRAVFLTHYHVDHVGGARAVAERLGVPLWAHADTAERLGLPVERLLVDGDVLELDGAPPLRFRVLHTPGHAQGHLCLLEERSRAALVGDMVAGLGTIVIDPPEGDMADYLAQLARLEALPVGALYPAHGPPIPDGPAKLREYIQHRLMREQLVLEALGEGATVEDILPRAYPDVPPFVYPLAERNAQAILIKLLREGRVHRQGTSYFLGPK